jgi:hypothetical protein
MNGNHISEINKNFIAWPTQVDQDLLAINRQKTYTLYIHTGIRKGINGPHRLFG